MGNKWFKLKICVSTLIQKQRPTLQETDYLVREMFFCQTAPKSDLMKGGFQERSAGDQGRSSDSAVRPREAVAGPVWTGSVWTRSVWTRS